MSGWFDEQLRTRMRSDLDSFANAFGSIAESITGKKVFNPDGSSNAIEDIARFYNIPGRVLKENKDEGDFRLRLSKIFTSQGIMLREVILSPNSDWYKDAAGIYLAMTQNGYYVALIPDYMGYAYKDYESGEKIRINAKTLKNLSPEAICFYRSLPSSRLSVKDLIVFALKSFSLSDVISIALITLAVTLLSMITPYLTQIIYSQTIYSNNFSALSAIFIFIASAGISVTLLDVAKNLALSRINIKTDTCVNAAIMMRVINLPTEFFKDFSSGELAQRAESASILCDTCATVIFSVILTALTSLIYLRQIFVFTPVLVLPALLIVTALFIASVLLTWGNSKIMKRSTQLNAKEYGLIYSFVTGIQKIKLSGSEMRAFAKWAELYKDIAKLNYDPPVLIKLTQVFQPAITLLGTFLLYYRALNAGVSPEDYMAFSASYGLLSGAFAALSGAALSMAAIDPLVDLIKPILNAVPESSHGKSLTRFQGTIELNNVSFRYNASSPLVLDKFSLKIHKGEYVAIVGRSGEGKSTLLRLLLGFERPDKGVIYYDNHDLRTLDIKSLRSKIGCVMQNSKLFPGSIYSNIVISAPSLTEEDAWEAAKMAGIDKDIEKMPMKMHTMISEGAGTISGGQRQRIIIARAIAPKPKILLFDEATSALDNITQKIVYNSLASLKCTRLVIAHRLSTVRNCDRILVLDSGRIAESGTYDELMNRNGLFTELVRHQI
ncbi:MAG: ATP-binding cassette domain-containing protein [Synergistaceae bacterium]|nr:ATP-binding cassette domain-containing protein [Synergistaceae bacterium]